MQLYYLAHNFRSIQELGFTNETVVYDEDNNGSKLGVLLSDAPLVINYSDGGEQIILSIDVPDNIANQYQVVSAKSYREFLVPAELLNRYGPPSIFAMQSETRLFLRSMFRTIEWLAGLIIPGFRPPRRRVVQQRHSKKAVPAIWPSSLKRKSREPVHSFLVVGGSALLGTITGAAIFGILVAVGGYFSVNSASSDGFELSLGYAILAIIAACVGALFGGAIGGAFGSQRVAPIERQRDAWIDGCLLGFLVGMLIGIPAIIGIPLLLSRYSK